MGDETKTEIPAPAMGLAEAQGQIGIEMAKVEQENAPDAKERLASWDVVLKNLDGFYAAGKELTLKKDKIDLDALVTWAASQDNKENAAALDKAAMTLGKSGSAAYTPAGPLPSADPETPSAPAPDGEEQESGLMGFLGKNKNGLMALIGGTLLGMFMGGMDMMGGLMMGLIAMAVVGGLTDKDGLVANLFGGKKEDNELAEGQGRSIAANGPAQQHEQSATPEQVAAARAAAAAERDVGRNIGVAGGEDHTTVPAAITGSAGRTQDAGIKPL